MFAKDFRERANLKMKGKGSYAALAYLIVTILTGAAAIITYGKNDPFMLLIDIAGIVIGGPMMYGFFLFIAEIGKGNRPDLSILFNGFKNFVNSFLLYLLYSIYLMLWTMLFIIPGFIKVFAYSMSWYIMIENPGIGPNEAITKSRLMMKGHKWRLFCLQFSYIGWILLSILTLGIYLFWLAPKMELAKYEFYQDLKTRVNF